MSTLLIACSPAPTAAIPSVLGERYANQQPALSGSGQYLAFVSNRNGRHSLLLYDLKASQMIDLPPLNRGAAIADSPSLSNNARYIVYLTRDRGRTDVELYDRITRRLEVLTSGYRSGWIQHPNISPDGRYIVFETGKRGQWDIERIDRGPKVELDLLEGDHAA